MDLKLRYFRHKICSVLHLADPDQAGSMLRTRDSPNISIPDPEFGVQKGTGSGSATKNLIIFTPKLLLSSGI
jgi:hypothetical protein